MRAINSLEEYKALLAENKARHCGIDTNSFLMKKDVERMISGGSLYVEEYPSGLVLFSDEGDYYKAYYHIGKDQGFPSITVEKPVIIDELDKAGKRSSQIDRIREKAERKGFRYYRTNRQYEKDLGEKMQEMKETPAPLNLLFLEEDDHPLTEDLLRQSVQLWDENLELADIEVAHRKLEANTGIACIVTPENRVVVTEWYKNEDGRSEGRHTVTDRHFRGRGLASRLLDAWCGRAAEAGMQKAVTWIADVNTASIQLHRSVGFQETDTVCRQYIKN